MSDDLQHRERRRESGAPFPRCDPPAPQTRGPRSRECPPGAAAPLLTPRQSADSPQEVRKRSTATNGVQWHNPRSAHMCRQQSTMVNQAARVRAVLRHIRGPPPLSGLTCGAKTGYSPLTWANAKQVYAVTYPDLRKLAVGCVSRLCHRRGFVLARVRKVLVRWSRQLDAQGPVVRAGVECCLQR